MEDESHIHAILDAIRVEAGMDPKGENADRFLSKKEAQQILSCIRTLKKIQRGGDDAARI